MDYAGWIQVVTAILEYDVGDATSDTPTSNVAFNDSIPNAIDYVENRLQRDLDFIATTVTSTDGIMTPNSRTITLPSVDLSAVSQIPLLVGKPIAANSIITTTFGQMLFNVQWVNHGMSVGQNVSLKNPIKVGGLTIGGVYNVVAVVDPNNITLIAGSNATSSASATVVGDGIFVVVTSIQPIVGGQRLQPLEPVTRDFLDFCWPSETSPGANILPVQWCPNDQVAALVGPPPDQAYGFVTVGTMRVPKLSSVNYTNFLTVTVPDLYVAASMVWFFGWQRDFGGQSEDPQTAQSWENQYQLLLKGAGVEEIRKRFADNFPSPTNPSSLSPGG